MLVIPYQSAKGNDSAPKVDKINAKIVLKSLGSNDANIFRVALAELNVDIDFEESSSVTYPEVCVAKLCHSLLC